MNLKILDNEIYFTTDLFGNKAAGLHCLLINGIKIPQTFLLPTETEILDEDILFLFENIKSENVIVRSSSELEDSLSNSYAGVFLSKKATQQTISKVISEIREHAISQAKNLFRQEIKKIAVIIQPYISGIGGVYLYDKECKKEKLELSLFGTNSITSGKSTEQDLVKSNSKEYQYALKECRLVAEKISTALDLEFVLEDSGIVFFQFRQLTKSIESVDELELQDSEYFPYLIKPLCGTLWAKILTKSLGKLCIYENGFLKIITHEDDFSIQNFDDKKLEDAITFYKEKLFVKWEQQIQELIKIKNENKNENFGFIFNTWNDFIYEYFTNDYEPIIDFARENSPFGASLSPYICNWFNDLNNLADIHKNGADIKSHSQFLLFLKKYGKSFIPNSNYFDSYSVMEDPEQLINIIENIENTDIIYSPIENPSTILRAAWIAEDDNRFKNEFSFLLRKSILELADSMFQKKFLSNKNEIWNIEIDELLSAIQEDRKPKVTQSVLLDDLNVSNDETVFTAVVLSSGNCFGEVFTKASESGENKIFVKNYLDTWDYPTLLKCKGAVVGFGSMNAHFAIFARDFGKPIFKSFNAVKKLTDGKKIELSSKKKTVILTV